MPFVKSALLCARNQACLVFQVIQTIVLGVVVSHPPYLHTLIIFESRQNERKCRRPGRYKLPIYVCAYKAFCIDLTVGCRVLAHREAVGSVN